MFNDLNISTLWISVYFDLTTEGRGTTPTPPGGRTSRSGTPTGRHADSSIDSTDDPAFERRVYALREEYNDCMDDFRKLKYQRGDAEAEKQTDNVVRVRLETAGGIRDDTV